MTKPAKAILIVSKGYPPDLGGIETYTRQMALAYADAGFAVYIVTQYNGPTGWTHDGPLAVYNTGPAPQIILLGKFFVAIRTLLNRVPVAAIHTTTWRTALPVLLNAPRQPLFVTVHGRELMTATGLLSYLARYVLSKARKILVISHEALKRCSTVAPILRTDRAVISYNGISNLPFTQRRSTPTPTVLIACRLTAFKNVKNALEAVRLVVTSSQLTTPFRVVVAGDGPERSMLTQFVIETKLGSIVTFLGQVPHADMPALYATADIFLHPQISILGGKSFESFCLAIADAMASGLPTIAGRDGAPAEYIENGVTGIIVDGHAQHDIATALLKLLLDPQLRLHIGHSASRFAKITFAWPRHIQPILECIS